MYPLFANCSLCSLYNWRYTKLGDLPHVQTWPEYCVENPGFFFDYQLIDVPDFNGVGESEPNPYFYQVKKVWRKISLFCGLSRQISFLSCQEAVTLAVFRLILQLRVRFFVLKSEIWSKIRIFGFEFFGWKRNNASKTGLFSILIHWNYSHYNWISAKELHGRR